MSQPMVAGAESASTERIQIRMPDVETWPVVACTLEELTRLRDAHRSGGKAGQLMAKRIQQAEGALQREVAFPPEGGQHNQWYQCDKCQIALQTVDDTHHRCTKCGETYSGYPYDNVIYSRKHSALTRDMEDCAWAYALTGDERFAQHSRDVLVGYAERYESYPYHSANMGKKTDKPSRSGGHVFEQTLNEASWAHPVCVAYDLVSRSKALSPQDHSTIRQHLLRPLYENIAKHRAGKSNWQTYHDSAFMLLGGVLRDESLIRQALEDPENGFFYQMEVSVLPGGMWYENSWSYHFYTLGAVQRITETARRLGIDLYSTPQVKEMYTVAMDYRMTDGTLPRLGDATTSRISGHYYEVAYHQWPEPQFLAVLPATPTWESVLYGRTQNPVSAGDDGHQSVLKRGAGHAILRTDGPNGPSSAAITFGPFGGFHGHFDKLSFVYFGLDRELGYDPGRARSQAYRLPIHRNWYRATTSHNTVLVDRVSQEGVEGTCDLFATTPSLSAVAASTDMAYEGVFHRRLLLLRPGFLVVIDTLDANDGKEHTFDWLYHNLGDSISSPAATNAESAPDGQGFEYMQDVHHGQTDGPIHATVEMDGPSLEVCANGEEGSEVLIGTGVGESVLHRVPLICITRRGQSARFAAVIEPVPANGSAQVQDVSFKESEAGSYEVHLQLSDGTKEVASYDPKGRRRVIAGIESQAQLLYLSQNVAGEFTVLAEVGMRVSR